MADDGTAWHGFHLSRIPLGIVLIMTDGVVIIVVIRARIHVDLEAVRVLRVLD